MSVSLLKWEGRHTVARAIECVNGWADFRSGMKVLVKPNAVMAGSSKIPCRGITTSPEIVGEVVHLARQRGAASVVIAEGSVELPTLKLDTAAALEWSGIQALAEQESIPLIDLNKGPFRDMTLIDGTQIEIAQAVYDADFVINIPVLKTHNQTVTTICLKNLKGCLSMEAKKKCHIEADLDQAIAELNRLIPCHLNVIDALTATEIGPTPTGKTNQIRDLGLLMAGQDRLQCDVLGSFLLGYPAASVPHIVKYAQLIGGSVDLEDLTIVGEDPSHYRMELQYCSSWLEDLMEKFAVNGLRMPPYGNRLCSACGFNLWAGLHGFCRTNQGLTVEGEAELCAGLEISPSFNARHTILLGKCAIQSNKELGDFVKVPGCPPDPAKVVDILTRTLVGGKEIEGVG